MQPVISVEQVRKEYYLGAIGGRTLNEEINGWINRKNGIADKAHKKFIALDDISVQINEGDTLGIIGANGAGKSTLLKIISHITAPSSGTVRIHGRIASMLEVGTGFHGELTGRENIFLNGAILGMKKSEIERKMDDIIDFSECSEFIDTPVKRYSSGMYVKLAFSVAAHLDSEILIMDEVLAVGDMKFQKKCLEKMNGIAKNGRTILYVSHNMATISELCNRCIVLDHGKKVLDGPSEAAVRLYLGNIPDGAGAMDYSGHIRYSWLSRNDVRLLKAEYIETNQNIFSEEDEFKLYIKWVNNTVIKNLCFRIEICNDMDVPVATAAIMDFYHGEAKNVGEAIVQMDLSMIACGEYHTNYTFYYVGYYKETIDLDCVHGLDFVKKNKSERLKWVSKAFGSISLPDLVQITI